MNVSFSEAEYNEAYRLRKPCLVYLRDEDVPILPKYFESNPENLQRLLAFKGILRQRHTIAQFRDANDLAIQVAADLSRTVQVLEQALKNQTERAALPQATATQEITGLVDEALDKGIDDRKVISVVRQAMSYLLRVEGLRRPTVFLSHSTGDRHIAMDLGHALRAEGVDPWLDIEQIQLGDLFLDKLEAGLDSADAIAVFISTRLGKWQNAELGAVLQRRLSGLQAPLVLPILTGDAEIPAVLRDTTYLDLRDGDVVRVAKSMVSAIRRDLH
jgi:TIR domain